MILGYENGSSGIGTLILIMSIFIFIIAPFIIGIIEYQLYEIEKKQVRISTYMAAQEVFESVSANDLSEKRLIPDLTIFQNALNRRLENINCNIKVENLELEWREQVVFINFSYIYSIDRIKLKKIMRVNVKHYLPMDY